MASLKPLIMRANRLLGASLVERGLVTIEDLDAANERFLELLSTASGELRLSLLSILLNEKESLKEAKLIEHLVEEEGLGIIDIRNMEVPEEVAATRDISDCWATWTVPFDQVEDTRYLATAYYMSPAVRAHWEQKYPGNLVWFAAPLGTIVDYLDTLEAEDAKSAMAAS